MARFTPFAYNGREGLIVPTKETIDGIENAIRWAESEVPLQMREGMMKLTQVMAIVNQGHARRMSFGPSDPNAQDPSQAWKIPVRRITGRYYLGWKVRPVPGGWQLYNDSREAFFIEFGINWLGEGRRVRRPVQRLSLKKTMETMQTTGAYHRIWSEIYRLRHQTMGFYQQVQAPGGAYISGWEDVSKQTAMNQLNANPRAGSMFGAGIRMKRGGSGFQRAVYNKGGGSYSGPMLGRKLP